MPIGLPPRVLRDQKFELPFAGCPHFQVTVHLFKKCLNLNMFHVYVYIYNFFAAEVNPFESCSTAHA